MKRNSKNIFTEKGHSAGGFSLFSSASPTNAKVFTPGEQNRFIQSIFPFEHSSSFYHLTSLTVTTDNKVKIIFKNKYKFQFWKSNMFPAF